MQFRFIIECTVERDSGKFASRNEIKDAIIESLEQSDPSEIYTDAGSTYIISDWYVSEEELTKGKDK